MPYTPAAVTATELDPDLVADLDDDTLLLSLEAAFADDQAILLAEIRMRRLDV